MHGDAPDDEHDPERLDARRNLAEHGHADDRRRRRQQRDQQRVARAREPRIASWSQTYGITDEEMPTPTPAASATGSREVPARRPSRRSAWRRRARRASTPERVDAARPRASRDAVAEHDVEREQGRVRDREGDAERLAAEHDVGEQVDAGNGESSAAPFRRVRAPSAASAITGRNSIAATVPSGSRSIAR